MKRIENFLFRDKWAFPIYGLAIIVSLALLFLYKVYEIELLLWSEIVPGIPFALLAVMFVYYMINAFIINPIKWLWQRLF